MGLIKGVFVIVLLVSVLFELIISVSTFQLKSDNSSLSDLPLPLPLQAPLTIESKNKFVVRKCCGPNYLYNINWADNIAEEERCVKYSISSSHPQKSPQFPFLLGSKESFPSTGYDVQIDAGFPRNCTPDSNGNLLDALNPQESMIDFFRALSSGQLIVPHRFAFYKFDSYCIEDCAEERNFSMATRRAFVCSSQKQIFPETAVDDSGKLRLDFMNFDADDEIFASKFVGRRVIRKCCPHGKSMDSNTNFNGWPMCRRNEDLVTLFFEQLQSQDTSIELFFRFGRFKCDNPIRTMQFQLNSNGSLDIIEMLDNSSSHRLLSIEQYCLDDTVGFDDYGTGLPTASIYAFYCPEELGLTEEPFTTESSFPTESSLPTESSFPTDLSIKSEIEPGESTIAVPKCCSPGHVMHENENSFDCHPLWWWPTESVWNQPIDSAEMISQSLSHEFQIYHNVSNTVFVSNTSLSSCKLGQRQQSIPLIEKSQKNPLFRINSKNQLSLAFHSFIANYWDVKEEKQSYCVDHLLNKEERVVLYVSRVFHCIAVEAVNNSYRPAILLISIVALLVTFVIYFFVPASGAAKLVLQVKGKKNGMGNKTSRSKSMAMVLTGRILLCHIISLSLAFTCLVIVQLNIIDSGENSCAAIGYITYWSFIASFSWLTVYCFDYYRIFSGSFKVSNDTLFIPYSAFGWGVPILTTIATIVAQFQSTAMGISDAVNPNMGLNSCWFLRGSLSETIFFYGPVGVLLSMDIYFFLSLMFNSNLMHCWQKPQGTAIRSNRRPSTASKEQEDLKMAMKLFFITGVPWIFEFIAYLFELKYGLYTRLWYFLEFSNLLNQSRGVFIFVNFIILNRDVRKFLWLRMKNIYSRKLFSPSEDEDNTATHHTHTEDIHSTSTNGQTSSTQFVSPSPSVITVDSETNSTSINETSNEYSIL